MGLKERAQQLKRDLPAVFLSLKKPETSIWAKILAGVTVAYALSPIDLVPDFIPVLGYLDDLLILPGLCALTLRMISPEILSACREEAADLWKDGKPKKWYYAVPIVLLWIWIFWLVLRAVWH